jgi:hypothetical protein
MRKILILLFIPTIAFANIAEFFGASATTMGIGNQSNFNSDDPANNIYNASLLANSEENSFSFNQYAIDTNFKSIDNIIVTSPINSGETSDQYGSVDTNYDNQYLNSIHGSFKIFKALKAKLNISLIIPMEKVVEANTGDPYRPEYVMYRARFKRTIAYLSYAQQLQKLSFSVGVMTGLQSNGETYVVARDSGSSNPTSGKMQFNAKPSAALNFSLSRVHSWGETYFSFQDEMKSNLKNTASGYTPIGASSLKYNWDLSTMLYYDPRVYRFGINKKNFIMSIEYQDWSGYETPILNMKSNGGILISSEGVENFKTRNIIIPKLAYTMSDFSIGISYRQSPLDLIEGASGNSVDVNTTILSLGHNYQFKALEQDFNFSSAFQLHSLETTKIIKSANRENGDASGNKIGFPEYKASGSVYALSFGLNWVI